MEKTPICPNCGDLDILPVNGLIGLNDSFNSTTIWCCPKCGRKFETENSCCIVKSGGSNNCIECTPTK